MKHNVIVDLDGTLANRDHRLHYLDRTPKDFDGFMEACDQDTPVEQVLYLIRMLAETGHSIYVLTGRSTAYWSKTVDWLARHDVPYDFMQMRLPEEQFRPDADVKRDMVRDLYLTPENTLVVFDDRDSVVRMWREEGFHVHQVAEGNF